MSILREELERLIDFQSKLVQYAQQITPYVDTNDRYVAGLSNSLAGAISGLGDELDPDNAQVHAALTAAREEGRIMEAVRRIRIVRTLHERMRAMPYGYGPTLPSNDPDLERRYFATQSLARKDYAEAEERWKRENFGLNPYYIDHEDRQKITDRILNHLGRKLADCEYKLNRFNGKATYVS